MVSPLFLYSSSAYQKNMKQMQAWHAKKRFEITFGIYCSISLALKPLFRPISSHSNPLFNPRCVDLRTVSYEVPPQEMLSRDSVTVSVDAVCFYKISNPLAAVCNVGNYTHSTNLLVATSLRNVLGTKTLAEILSERETICHVMEHILDEATRPWGVKVHFYWFIYSIQEPLNFHNSPSHQVTHLVTSLRLHGRKMNLPNISHYNPWK